MPDARTPLQRKLDEVIGKPLYYCEECKLAVKVTEAGIERPCNCNGRIIAPRKAIVAGAGGLGFSNRMVMAYRKTAATLTGRNV